MDGTNQHKLSASAGTGRRYRPAFAIGMLISVGFHTVLFLLWSTAVKPLEGVPGADRRDASSGGGTMQALRVAPPREIEVPPRPALVSTVAAPEVEFFEPASLSSGVTALSSPRPGAGRGRGGGDHEGDGGDGNGEAYSAPVPRSIVPQWDPPGKVKGMRVTVRVMVDARGLPTGEVELVPPTPDRGFNERLIEGVRRMAYRPARRNGEAVEGWAEITFVF